MRKQVMKSHGNALRSHPPAISYRSAQHSYFIHSSQVYPLADCPSQTFKEAILAKSPSWPYGSSDDASKLLRCKELDLEARWFLICLLGIAKCPLRLYGSKEAAERALWCGHDVGRFGLIVAASISARL